MPRHKTPNYNTEPMHEARRLSTHGKRITKPVRVTLPAELADMWEILDKAERDAVVEAALRARSTDT